MYDQGYGCYQFGPHLLVVTTKRPFWRPWRKLHILRCYECGIKIDEWWPNRNVRVMAHKMQWRALGGQG